MWEYRSVGQDAQGQRSHSPWARGFRARLIDDRVSKIHWIGNWKKHKASKGKRVDVDGFAVLQ